MLKGYIGRLGKNSMIYGVGNMLTKMLALLILPFLTAYINPEEYGIISMFTTFSTFVQPVFQLGLSAGITPVYFEQKKESDKNRVIFFAFIILLISSLLMLAICFIGRSYLSEKIIGIAGYENLFFIFMGSVAIASLEVPFLYKYQFEEKALRFVIITAVTSVVWYGILYILIIHEGMGVSGYITGLLISEIFRFIAYFGGVKISFQNMKNWLRISKRLLKISFPFVPSFFSLYVLQQIGRIILQAEYGLEATGIYSVGINIGSAINIVIGGIITAWTPFFLSFQNKTKEESEILGKITTLYLFVVGTITLCFFSFSKPVVLMMVDEAFYESYSVVGMYACSLFFNGLFSFLLPPLYYANETKYISLLQIPAAVIAVFISKGLIALWGIRGAGVSIAMNYLILALITIYWNQKHSYYFRITYQKRNIVLFCVFFLISVAAITIMQKRNFPLWREWVRALISSFGFGIVILGYLCKITEAWKFIRRRGKK